MKIPASIRRIHEDQLAVNERLRTLTDERMKGLRRPRWHYESRLKELPSFAIKIESGRVNVPTALEDFFACTIVVANANEIDAAEKLICDTFTLKYKRPPQQDKTLKPPDSFTFDDLRLYVTMRKTEILPPTDLDDVIFEVQIKTFLQHAWSIATHDLVYKTDDLSWSKQRIAYQIKAMLEHAEISIQEAETLAASTALAKEHYRTAAIRAGIKLVKSQWTDDQLPPNLRGLAENITNLSKGLRLEIARLEAILEEGKAKRAGSHPTNLSPYATVVQYLFEAEADRFIDLLKDENWKGRVLIPAEIEFPPDFARDGMRNAVFLSGDGA